MQTFLMIRGNFWVKRTETGHLLTPETGIVCPLGCRPRIKARRPTRSHSPWTRRIAHRRRYPHKEVPGEQEPKRRISRTSPNDSVQTGAPSATVLDTPRLHVRIASNVKLMVMTSLPAPGATSASRIDARKFVSNAVGHTHTTSHAHMPRGQWSSCIATQRARGGLNLHACRKSSAR